MFQLSKTSTSLYNKAKYSPLKPTNTLKSGISTKVDFALQISEKDNFVLYDWPGISVLNTGDFSLELLYKTPHQPRVRDAVAIISNARESIESEAYGRYFKIMLLPDGRVEVSFSGHEISGKFHRGLLVSNTAVDNEMFYHLLVTRKDGKISLFIDGNKEGDMPIPESIDLEGQEQRVIFGGGNDRFFRKCVLDEIRFWTVARDPSFACVDRLEESLVAYFNFNIPSEGVFLEDSSVRQGGAIRVGNQLESKSSFVQIVSIKFPRCYVFFSEIGDEKSDTLVISYLGMPCGSTMGSILQTGHLYQLEAYIGALWLDANRVQIDLLIVTECVPDSVVSKYTTNRVKFVKKSDVLLTLPCTGPVYVERFLVINKLLQGPMVSNYSHIVSTDLRDSRIIRYPDWSGVLTNADLVLQSISNNRWYICGGFQAGIKEGMQVLYERMAEAIESMQCQENDQELLNRLFGVSIFHKLLGGDFVNWIIGSKGLGIHRSRIAIDAFVVNSQQTRVFDITPFLHGNWWRTSGHSYQENMNAYPLGIPFQNHGSN